MKSFEVGHNILDGITFQIDQGQRVGLLGKNGAGKSTLFKMITGREQPDSGEIKIGTTVKLAAVDQMRDSLPNDKTCASGSTASSGAARPSRSRRSAC